MLWLQGCLYGFLQRFTISIQLHKEGFQVRNDLRASLSVIQRITEIKVIFSFLTSRMDNYGAYPTQTFVTYGPPSPEHSIPSLYNHRNHTRRSNHRTYINPGRSAALHTWLYHQLVPRTRHWQAIENFCIARERHESAGDALADVDDQQTELPVISIEPCFLPHCHSLSRMPITIPGSILRSHPLPRLSFNA